VPSPVQCVVDPRVRAEHLPPELGAERLQRAARGQSLRAARLGKHAVKPAVQVCERARTGLATEHSVQPRARLVFESIVRDVLAHSRERSRYLARLARPVELAIGEAEHVGTEVLEWVGLRDLHATKHADDCVGGGVLPCACAADEDQRAHGAASAFPTTL